jgi:hypothetical protein
VVWELENGKPGHQCISQFRYFSPGMSFMHKMREAAEAECTIALFSPHYFRSEYCQSELAASQEPSRKLNVAATR